MTDHSRYFFETDLLFRLNTLRAVAFDVPMDAHYGDEESTTFGFPDHLRVLASMLAFLQAHLLNYFLRDLSVATVELVAGTLLVLWAPGFGC